MAFRARIVRPSRDGPRFTVPEDVARWYVRVLPTALEEEHRRIESGLYPTRFFTVEYVQELLGFGHAHSGSDSDSSSSENEGKKELFGCDSASLMGLRELASQRPGVVYEFGPSQVARQMGLGGFGPHDSVDLAKIRMEANLVNRWIPKSPKMSVNIEKEFRANCEARGQLEKGRPAGAADLMMHQVKALVTTLRGDCWTLAGQQVNTDDVDGRTSLEERHMAAKQRLEQLQLEAAAKKVSSGGAGLGHGQAGRNASPAARKPPLPPPRQSADRSRDGGGRVAVSSPRRKTRRRRGGQGQEDTRTPRGDAPAREGQRRDRARRVDPSRSNSPAVLVAQPPSVELPLLVAVDRTVAVAGAAGGGYGAERGRVWLTANPNRSPTRILSTRSPSLGGLRSPRVSPIRPSPRGGVGRLRGEQQQARDQGSPSPGHPATASPSPRTDAAQCQSVEQRDGGRDQIQTRSRTRGWGREGGGNGGRGVAPPSRSFH